MGTDLVPAKRTETSHMLVLACNLMYHLPPGGRGEAEGQGVTWVARQSLRRAEVPKSSKNTVFSKYAIYILFFVDYAQGGACGRLLAYQTLTLTCNRVYQWPLGRRG